MDTTRILSSVDATQRIDPFRTQMSPPPGAGPLSIGCLPGSRCALNSESSLVPLLVQIQAGSAPGGRRQPLNIALVIDRSGSMEGQPLTYAKQACAHVVDLLTPEDLLSIVTFEESVDVVMPARRVMNKELIKQHVERIQAGRTTNLYDGLVAGFSQVAGALSPGTLNRVLLLTDGEPTSGLKDFNSIVGQVAEQKSRGISLTALGFGPDYNEELLAAMARRTGGNYYYITRPELLPEVFRSELESLLTVVASNLRLRLNLFRWVTVRQVFGHPPSFGPRWIEVALADLERGASLNVVAEMELGARPSGAYRVAQAELTFDDSGGGRAGAVARADAVVEFTPDAAKVAAAQDPFVAAQVELAQASRALERTVMGMRTQQISAGAAISELEKTQTFLAHQGRALEAAEVGQALDALRHGSPDGAEKTLIGTVYNLDKGKS